MTPPQLIAQSERKQCGVILVAVDQHLRKSQRIVLICRVGDILHIPADRVLQISVDSPNVAASAQAVNPERRRMHGYIQHDADPGLRKQIHYFIKPFEGIHALIRLVAVPAQMTQTDRCKTGFFHHIDVDPPTGGGPVMRVIVASDIQTHFFRSLFYGVTEPVPVTHPIIP